MKLIRSLIPAACGLVLLGVAGCTPDSDSSSGSESKRDMGRSEKIGPAENAEEPVELKLRWPVGKKVMVEFKTESVSILTLPGNLLTNESVVGMDYSLSVIRTRPEGGVEVDMQYHDQSIAITVNGRDAVRIDSGGESISAIPAEALGGLASLAGTKLKAFLDATNSVERLEGVQEFTQKVNKAGGGAEGVWNEGMFKQMFRFTDGMSGREVKVGESWKEESEIELGPLGMATQNAEYTFKGWEMLGARRVARLDVTATFLGKGMSLPGAGGVTMKMNSGSVAGKIWYDPAIGMPVDQDSKMTFLMDLNIPGLGELKDQKTEQSFKIRVGKVTDLP